jgi:hypothetical protein
MRKIFLLVAVSIFVSTNLFAQLPGDTIVVNSFNYGQTYRVGDRDTVLQFPNLPGISFQRILMTYNMRCKNGVVGNLVTPQSVNGCGEWDYSCNTYIIDSTKTDSVKAKGPSHVISAFSGNTFNYTTQPTYTYYNYTQQQVSYAATISETSATLGNGNQTSNAVLHTQLQNGKSQYLWTATELGNAGLTAGNITGLQLSVSNAGSAAQFLKIRMKHTTQTSLSASMPDVSGFTEVYFLNTTLVNGINQFNFYNNFAWNGNDNVLVEFSFSNAANGSDNIVLSDTNTAILGLISTTNDYSFEFDGSNKINVGTANFASIASQLTISFWANGNVNALPAQTSILEATNNNNQREVNIHFPWSNSNIYWDCGNATGGTDRINQLAITPQIEGVWNHWAFTKNTATGVMNIYLNGTLWLSGTGKTIPIAITNLVLGTGISGNFPYFGKIDDLSIWDTELSQPTIAAWMNKTITNAHPNYANLQAYYTMNDGIGNTCTDASAVPSFGTIIGGALWKATKGKDIYKNFEETNNRPFVTFLQGVYTQSTTTITAMDSAVNNASFIKEYAVTNNNYSLASTYFYYQAGYTYVYNGDNLQLLDSVLIPTTGTINITQLNYMRRSPSRFQIMSFVTPYGNGLDLGVNGKTYTFDVTDFAPLLKGTKRMTMDAGGQWQEDMDIKFLFIVGTPPREAKDITNLWKVDAVDYANIMNDNYYEPRTYAIDPSGKYFKVRTVISGHGQEGEFIPRYHLFNINGGADEFNWQVLKGCAENPVYPQGGTWVYDRAGWCPGMATDIQENDITPYVTPGTNAIVDYNITTASGDSRYWVSNQLVTYGAANFTLDASIIDVKNPSKKIEYARNNAICGRPIVTLRNSGKTPLTTAVIDYWVNDHSPKESFTWTGNLAFMETIDVTLPYNDNLWGGVKGAIGNVFHAEVRNPNAGTDEYALNNKFNSAFDITGVVPSNFIIWFKSNNDIFINSYELRNGNGDSIFARNLVPANTLYKDTFKLAVGCYQLIIKDAGEDGLSWWANSAQGSGFCYIKKGNGTTMKVFNPDFGKSIVYNFTIDFPMKYEDIYKEHLITLYPNPAHQQFTIEAAYIQQAKVAVYNTYGQLVQVPFTVQPNKLIFNSSNLAAGVYSVLVNDVDGNVQTMKVIVE